MKVTSINEIIQHIMVPLPGWGIDDTFNVKLKNFSILDVASKGEIPNPLIKPVIDLFGGKGIDMTTVEGFKSFSELTELFCETCLVEPTYKELKENGKVLTDDQRLAIYNFATKGAKALIPFLAVPTDNDTSDNGEDVSKDTKRTTKDRG